MYSNLDAATSQAFACIVFGSAILGDCTAMCLMIVDSAYTGYLIVNIFSQSKDKLAEAGELDYRAIKLLNARIDTADTTLFDEIRDQLMPLVSRWPVHRQHANKGRKVRLDMIHLDCAVCSTGLVV